MNLSEPQSRSLLPLPQRQRIDKLGDEFERQWTTGNPPRIEDFLELAEEADREHLLRELIAVELELRAKAGQEIDSEEYRRRFPQNRPVVDFVLDTTEALPARGTEETVPYASPPGDTNRDTSPALTSSDAGEMPRAIGRYQVLRLLGRGAFAFVYLARDPQLDRLVAIKVPRLDRFQTERALDRFLEEARNAAQLDHPGIVRVYDVQREPGLVYIVMQYIEGGHLGTFAKSNRLSPTQLAELLIDIADAVGYANKHGFVHRDLKPANILVDLDGKPHVADFGLALHESVQRDRAGEFAGTYPYMSPEQVRCESHRLDGRSDIWGLGAIFYELLTCSRPFVGETRQQTLDAILYRDPTPPRQAKPDIPRELSRICLACLAKRATDRYQVAADLIDDLRHWVQAEAATTNPVVTTRSKIVPKGLRSFDAGDSDFFLQLLPGPLDREGLPKPIRFWKDRIEKTDAEETFPVGLIYGPSGCGKSSLAKAGLIPRLNRSVLPLYVEATADDTEVRLIKGLRKHCPELPAEASLPGIIARLRDSGGARERKVVLIIDQFEQWLHAHLSMGDSQLVMAFRQCDGAYVQAVVLVRDDFWMSATRFMQELEVPLVEGHNSAAVDLFDPDHARSVLTAYGRAYGKLPELPAEPSDSQNRFLDEAVSGLTREGRIICVRLAVFAEMMKGRPWTEEGLREVGGTEGVGATFLEETFDARTAPPTHRLHKKAVKAVLKALLPEQGTDIRGQMKSYDDLLLASGYSDRRAEFDTVLRILDGELRLITPTEPDEPADDSAATETTAAASFYQLTHDYLVHSLHTWLMRGLRKTRRGRAELRLTERAAQWNAKPQNRNLPSWWEYLGIRLLTNSKQWSKSQRTMMRRADRVQGTRLGAALCLLVAIVIGTMFTVNQYRRSIASGYVEQSLQSNAGGVAPFTHLLRPLKSHAVPMLLKHVAEGESSPSERLHAACVLAGFGRDDFPFPIETVKDVEPGECGNIVSALEDAPADWKSALDAEIEAADAGADWSYKARLSILEMHLGDLQHAKGMLQIENRPDPVQRTQLIQTFIDWHADLGRLAPHIEGSDHSGLQSGLCLAVGSITEVGQEAKAKWQGLLEDWYRTAPDSGTHSAAGWALRQWNIQEPDVGPHLKDTNADRTKRNWIVTEVGLTLIRVPAGSFQRPIDPISDPNGQQQTVQINRDFFVSDREISVGLFQEFLNDPQYQGEKPDNWEAEYEFSEVPASHPVHRVTWYDAVMFCNWLSQAEDRTPYYRAREDGWELVDEANGYRLPTEAEWEYAARGCVTSDYIFGDDESLLDAYAVCGTTAIRRCGTKKPSNVGLFDIHGNVQEWCYDYWEREYGGGNPIVDPLGPVRGIRRVLRGGSFQGSGHSLRLLRHTSSDPRVRLDEVGFRVVRPASETDSNHMHLRTGTSTDPFPRLDDKVHLVLSVVRPILSVVETQKVLNGARGNDNLLCILHILYTHFHWFDQRLVPTAAVWNLKQYDQFAYWHGARYFNVPGIVSIPFALKAHYLVGIPSNPTSI